MTDEDDNELWVIGKGEASQTLEHVHPKSACMGYYCCLHNPSEHTMVTWRLYWREDASKMERLCEHGIGHPDPDDLAFRNRMGLDDPGVHGCDGCCRGK